MYYYFLFSFTRLCLDHFYLDCRSKSLGLVRFFIVVFKRSLLCSPRVHLFNQKYSEHSNIVNYYYNLNNCFYFNIYYKMSFIPVMQSWIFNIITPVFSVTRSLRTHSNILIWWILSILKTIELVHIFVETKKLKKTAFILFVKLLMSLLSLLIYLSLLNKNVFLTHPKHFNSWL